MTKEHPFAPYIRILGKGKRGSRGLTEDEACTAMRMILEHKVEPCQLGAFLMLLRVKEETAEEIAGFVRACRESFTPPESIPAVTLDWSSYAGKRRQLPWFILSVLLLVDDGVPVFMHGAEGHTADRVYTRPTLQALGLPLADSMSDASAKIDQQGFAYLSLEQLSPVLHDIIQMRPLLGLRSPVHTVARMLNPFSAPYQLQGIFHPSYRDTHQQAARLLSQGHMAVFKGEGGEIERNPDANCLVKSVHQDELIDEEWPALFNGRRHLKDEQMDINRLRNVWQGMDDDEYAIASVVGTAAIALKLLGRATTRQAAEQQARQLWQNRQRDRFETH